MNIKDIEKDIIEEFSVFSDWMDKYEYIIDLGKSLPKIAEESKREENLIQGCQSRVWLASEYKEGKLYFTADSDAIITKGIISLLIKVVSGREPKEIVTYDFDFLKEIGLEANLSPTRANGLRSMIVKMKQFASLFLK